MENGIGKRLRGERERLGLSQADFAGRAGITRNTQAKYEAGERSPDASYLALVAEIGVNVPYVLVGQTLAAQISPKEVALIDKYRLCPPSVQAGILALLQTVAAH